MILMKKLLLTAVAATVALAAAEAAQVFSWVDGNGVTHYSQHPPREDASAQVNMIDTVFSPNELLAIQKIKEEKKKLAEKKNAKNEEELIRGCKDLHNEKIRYYRRKIEDTYIANLNKCDMSVQSMKQSQARPKKEKCYAEALKVKMADISQLPTEDDCTPEDKKKKK
ncbi:MAG: DUF4124 domain-containing protein [Succinivibrionaceae bacterium]|nr:DUF4124 domain-containing protein [Succinivibrionaceae bacterium]